MKTFPAGSAFSAGSRTFRWTDVVLAAILRGDWESFSRDVVRRLTRSARAGAAGEAPSDEEVESAGAEFRYERDLISAEDMESWLERYALSTDDWMGYIERTFFGSMPAAADETDAGGAEAASGIDAEELEECLVIDAICSGALGRFAASLAARVAIDDRESADPEAHASAPSAEAIGRAVDALSAGIARAGLPGLDAPPDLLADLARMELVFDAHRRRFASVPALRAEIDANRLDWIRIGIQELSFAEEAAAREALLCLREDGETLEGVAANAHLPVREESVYLSEMDPAAKPDLLSARPGELVGPLAFGGRFHVFLLRDKTMPSEEDPDVRRRAEDAVVAKLVARETDARIRWLEPG